MFDASKTISEQIVVTPADSYIFLGLRHMYMYMYVLALNPVQFVNLGIFMDSLCPTTLFEIVCRGWKVWLADHMLCDSLHA